MATKRRKVRKTKSRRRKSRRRKSHRRSRKSCKYGKLKRKVKSRSGRKRRCKKKKSRRRKRRKRTYKINPDEPITPPIQASPVPVSIIDLQLENQQLRNACEEEIQRLRNENKQLQMSIFSLIINNDHRHGDSTNLNPDDFENTPELHREIVNIINSEDYLSNFSKCTKLITIWLLQELSNSLENDFTDETTRKNIIIEWISDHNMLMWILNNSVKILDYFKDNPRFRDPIELPIDLGNGITKTIEITSNDVYNICKWGIINL